MFLEVSKAEYLDGYRLKLFFNNGEVRIADLSSSLQGEVFEPLKDVAYFKRFTIRFNTVEWENGADFAPEYLYGISTSLRYPLDDDDAAVHFVADSNRAVQPPAGAR